MIDMIYLYRRENNSPNIGHAEMVWPFEYQGTHYFASAIAQSNRVIWIYKRDESETPFKTFRFDGARKVKVRGDKILACGELNCCLASVPSILSMVFKIFGYTRSRNLNLSMSRKLPFRSK